MARLDISKIKALAEKAGMSINEVLSELDLLDDPDLAVQRFVQAVRHDLAGLLLKDYPQSPPKFQLTLQRIKVERETGDGIETSYRWEIQGSVLAGREVVERVQADGTTETQEESKEEKPKKANGSRERFPIPWETIRQWADERGVELPESGSTAPRDALKVLRAVAPKLAEGIPSKAPKECWDQLLTALSESELGSW